MASKFTIEQGVVNTMNMGLCAQQSVVGFNILKIWLFHIRKVDIMRTWNRLVVLFYLTMMVAFANAQPPEVTETTPSLAAKYNAEAIYLRYSTYTKNNEVYRIGVLGGGLKHEFDSSPNAMALFKKYQNQRRWSLVCSALQITAAAVAFSSHNRSRRNTFQISGAAISIVAVPLYIGSYNNLNKAVWFRNGAIMTMN